MKVLIINRAEVEQLLPMDECMYVMEEALKTLGRGDAVNPLRPWLKLPEQAGLLVIMPSYLGNIKAIGLKVLSVFSSNQRTEHDLHEGAVLLFETEHGHLISIIDASAITAIRTAAVSGVATKLLARKDADDLAILGTGVEARTHLEAMLLARKIRRVRVSSRTPEHAQKFAERESAKHGIEVEPMLRAGEAVEGATIICTTTTAREPVLLGTWLVPGSHINAVGSSMPSARELDTAAVVKSRLFVDRRESALNEAGDFLIPKKEGAIDDDHIQGEIGEILLGQVTGRESPQEITLFKSLGLGIEDLASAHHIYRKALEKEMGIWVEWS